ncbi:MAG: UTP--glucose-1-phosphate uridylyltransferase GalU [Sulfuritalea sp.]|nr:UTP--glucose-1-phosphate uridylyltransferase GalU [Sulfuritalea sp.]
MKKITKAVFPVAGMGSRFLPATKASPKEMMPVVDKPLIQYAVEEAVAAGITDMVFITGRNKRAIEDHFDMAYELEAELEARGKHELLRLVQETVPSHINCIYIRQAEPLGLGHAVLCAAPVVGDEPFAVLLADDLIDADPPVLQQMVETFNEHECTLLGVQNVSFAETGAYGIVSTDPGVNGLQNVTAIVEKPAPEKAPSNLAVIGRYVLTPRIFHHLRQVQAGTGGEIQLTDAISALINEEPVLAFPFHGIRYDCGAKLGYLKASIAYGRKHPEVGKAFTEYLASLNVGGRP